jgi:DNA-binding SARP family transcriptional activator/TolB-like protein/cytochrome c-type biogenesis protein CcmH/NrfG
MQAPSLFRLRVLGQFALQVGGATVRISSRKGCGLLAVLGMQPGYKESRNRLTTLLWGDRYDKQARQNLRQCLASLRTDLAVQARDLLVFDGDTIGLNPGLTSIDAREFLVLAQSSDAVDIERAAALYQADFLAGFSLDVEPFEEWASQERARLASPAMRVFATHAANCERLGNSKRAIEAAERLVALDPLREDSQRLLLTLYARCDGPDGALAHFKALTDLLRRELGVDPDPSTASLAADIRRGAITSSSAAISTPLPKPVSSRERDTRQESQTARDVHPVPAASKADPWRAYRQWPAIGAATVTVLLSLAWLLIGPNSDFSWRVDGPHRELDSIRKEFAKLATKGVITFAVLPFSAQTEDAGQTIADSLANDLSAYLSRNTGVRVMPRQSTLYYRNRLNDAASVGAALGVRYVVEGALRTQDGRGRITIQLIETATGLQTWSTVIERDNIQSINVQDEIAKRLGRELHVEAGISTSSSKRSIANAEIPDLLARGRAARLRGATKENVTTALMYYEEALRREPDLVPALLGATAALVMGSVHRVIDPVPSLMRARKLVDRAIQLRPDSAGAHHRSGQIYKFNSEYDLAIISFRRAIEINPGFSPAYAHLASTLMYMGRFLEAKENIETAIRLSPSDRAMGFWLLIQGNVELELGNDRAALALLRRAETFLPTSPKVHENLAAVYALMGDTANSSKHVAAFKKYADPSAASQALEPIRLGAEGELLHRVRLQTGIKLAFHSPK